MYNIYSFFNLGARWYLGIDDRLFCTLYLRQLIQSMSTAFVCLRSQSNGRFL
jgi:hypothetical protein